MAIEVDIDQVCVTLNLAFYNNYRKYLTILLFSLAKNSEPKNGFIIEKNPVFIIVG